MSHNEDLSARLNDILAGYNRKSSSQVSMREVTYEHGWSEFVNNSIYGGSLDVSEMGASWINDFVAMGALRPLQQLASKILGDTTNYPPALLNCCSDAHGVYHALPWATDVSLVFYRRDLLQKAGIKEEDAFSSPARFDETLAALVDSGVKWPWTMPTTRSHVSLHALFIWLQAAGYNYVSETGKNVLLSEAGPRQVLRSYLSLYRYLAPEARGFDSSRSDRSFATGNSAVCVAGVWLLKYCNPEVRANLGLAIPMGKTYVGGSGLVLWNSSMRQAESQDLARMLSDVDFQAEIAYLMGLMPARLDSISRLPVDYVSPEQRQIIELAIRGGVSFPKTPLWGMVEDRLVTMLDMLWTRFFDSENDDLDKFLDNELAPVVNRLNMVLANYQAS